jgi:predicted RecA/RadA family phage recombinase
MKNFIQEGEYLDLTAPYAVSSGGGALVGITFGVAVTDVANGAVGSFATCGVFTMTKGTGASTGGAQGTAAYWNNSTKVITAVSSGNTKVGVFAATCADGDATCKVRLNGSF